MYIKQTKRTRGKHTYTCYLLVEGYRDEKKRSCSRVLMNLTSWKESKRKALQKILKGEMSFSLSEVATTAGKSIGALHLFKTLAEEMGIAQAIEENNGKDFLSRVLLLISGRILTQGSRRKLIEWSQTQEVEEALGINVSKLDTDQLYETLDYLADNQEEIEQRLFQIRSAKTEKTPRIYLYDVTSSYLEGEQNELAAYGYNRDKKKGKMQIVIGLLTDEGGYPIAVRVFTGNTLDPKTVHSQIQKLAESFGVKEVIFVGDKGMIKTGQIEELDALGFHYITSITKPQIRTLSRSGILQLSLFDDRIGEVVDEAAGIRYVYKRNPVRAEEMEKTRKQKQEWLQKLITKKNEYLVSHPKAKVETAEKDLVRVVEQRHCPWITVTNSNRIFTLAINQERLTEEQILDGCYVIKTDCMDKDLTAQIIHDRYKDLKYVEAAFRTIKTGFLEVRPIYVRKEKRTRGHIFVTMLSYLLIHEFKKRTKDIAGTLEHKVDSLDQIQTVILTVQKQTVKKIPQQPPFTREILSACSISLPIYCRN